MFTKIMVPVDGSENSYQALKYGAEIAKRFDAKLTILHVIPLTPRTIGITNSASITLVESLIRELHNEGEGFLAKAKEIAKPYGIECAFEITSGAPAQEILDRATADYDLIVIGSRGMGGVKGLILGSVSDRVSHAAKQPVLIVH